MVVHVHMFDDVLLRQCKNYLIQFMDVKVMGVARLIRLYLD